MAVWCLTGTRGVVVFLWCFCGGVVVFFVVVLCVVGFFVVVFLRCGGVFLSQETFILEASGVFCLCVFKLCFVCFLFVCFLSVLFVFSSLCFLSVCFSVCVCAMKGSRQLLSRSVVEHGC